MTASVGFAGLVGVFWSVPYIKDLHFSLFRVNGVEKTHNTPQTHGVLSCGPEVGHGRRAAASREAASMISIRSLTQSPAIASPQVTAAAIVAPAGVAASAAGANTAPHPWGRSNSYRSRNRSNRRSAFFSCAKLHFQQLTIMRAMEAPV